MVKYRCSSIYASRNLDKTQVDNLKYPSQKLVKERVVYDPCTGNFIWKERCISTFKTKRAHSIWNSSTAGNYAGSKFVNSQSKKSYISIPFDGVNFRAHRIAFVYMNGYIPRNMDVDHINGNGLDNRWENLRLVTKNDNMKNSKMPSTNTSGVVGVSWHKKRMSWQSFINVNGKRVSLGWFKDKDSAIQARKKAELKFNYHKNHGRDRPLY